EIHDRERDRLPADGRDARERGVLHAGLLLREREPFRVAHLRVTELQRVGGLEVREALRERVLVHEIAEVRARRNAEMEIAVRAGPEVLLEHGLEQRLAAALALRPEPLGDVRALDLFRGPDALPFAFQPGHFAGFSGARSLTPGRATPEPARLRRC